MRTQPVNAAFPWTIFAHHELNIEKCRGLSDINMRKAIPLWWLLQYFSLAIVCFYQVVR